MYDGCYELSDCQNANDALSRLGSQPRKALVSWPRPVKVVYRSILG
jgi:hypothetical protein